MNNHNHITKLILESDKLITDALKILNLAAEKIVFIVDTGRKLKGTVTDGDIRRAILNNIDVHSSVAKAMNSNPILCVRGVNEDEAPQMMQKNNVTIIPVVDKTNLLIDFHSIAEYECPLKRDTPVIIMAGGRGERLLPLTTETPKPLLKIGNRPILETILDSFIQHGFTNFYFSVNYKAKSIKDYFKDGQGWGINIRYLEEEFYLGTAGCLSLLNEQFDQPFILMNGDLLTKVDFNSLLSFHRQTNALATVCVREHVTQIPYGVVSIKDLCITDIVEKPIQKSFVNAGIYIIDPKCLSYVPKNQYFDMPSLLKIILQDNGIVTSFPIHEYWLDIGRLEDLQRAREEFLSDL
jgi:dTDP-glucose pyrophosphorylase